MNRPGLLLTGVAIGISGTQVARGETDVNAFVALTSDYVFRGISQTLGEPAVQGGVDAQWPAGFFAGLFASHVQFPPNPARERSRDLELDLYFGFGRETGPNWSWSASLIRYMYPDTSVDYDYTQLAVAGHFRDLLSASIYYSDDALARGDPGMAAELRGRYPISSRFVIGGGLGYYDIDRSQWHYTYADVGLSFVWEHLTLDLRYWDTGGNAAFVHGPEQAGDRVVVSVSVGN